MEFSVKYRGGFFDVKTSGDGELDKFGDLADAMFAYEEWKPGTPVLHDHTDLNSGPLTVDDIRGIAQLCADRRAQFGAGKLAVVVARDLEFGLARMWAVFAEDKWDVVSKVFRSREEAIAWLTV